MNAKARSRIKSKLFFLLLPLVICFVVTYTLYQLLSGERGLFTWLDLKVQITDLEQTNAALLREKRKLEQQVNLLYNKSIDWDYVDELSRKNLPYGTAEDEVIFLPDRTPILPALPSDKEQKEAAQ